MLKWDDAHPKADLLARKRAAILAAARQQFLSRGFGSSTMEGIAAAAGVSIATLYRHARTKDDLFNEIVHLRHDPAEIAAGLAQMAALPLDQALVFMGQGMLAMLLTPDILATHRMVIAEIERFPELGKVAHEGILAHVEETLTGFLASRIGDERGRAIAPQFLDRVIGNRLFLALLGALPPVEPETERARIASIVADLLR